MSVVGLAREIAAVLKKKLKFPNLSYIEVDDKIEIILIKLRFKMGIFVEGILAR